MTFGLIHGGSGDKRRQILAMLEISLGDCRLICVATSAVKPKILNDYEGNQWEVTYGKGFVSIKPKDWKKSLVFYTGFHLSDLVVFYKESELAEWRKGQNNG